MSVACVLAFLNFSVIAGTRTFGRPHWFFDHDRGHGFGAGSFLILALIILLIFFGIRALTGEGKN
jgi:hypothetical protein